MLKIPSYNDTTNIDSDCIKSVMSGQTSITCLTYTHTHTHTHTHTTHTHTHNRRDPGLTAWSSGRNGWAHYNCIYISFGFIRLYIYWFHYVPNLRITCVYYMILYNIIICLYYKRIIGDAEGFLDDVPHAHYICVFYNII
jgi:hypothetical protein